jgi:hypothetical protein
MPRVNPTKLTLRTATSTSNSTFLLPGTLIFLRWVFQARLEYLSKPEGPNLRPASSGQIQLGIAPDSVHGKGRP